MNKFETELKKQLEKLQKEDAYADLTIEFKDGVPGFLCIKQRIKLN